MKRLLTGITALLLTTAAYAGTAYFVGETEGTTTRQCHYEYLGDFYSITIPYGQLCPMTIQV